MEAEQPPDCNNVRPTFTKSNRRSFQQRRLARRERPAPAPQRRLASGGAGQLLHRRANAPSAPCQLPSRRNTRRWSPPAKIERDPAQEAIVEQLAQLERRLAEHRLARKSSSLGWVFGAAQAQRGADQGPLHLRRRRPRQDHADGSVLRGVAGRAQTPRAFPRVHGGRARAHLRVPAAAQARRASPSRTRSGSPPPPSPRRPGCFASTNSTSPTSPMP